MLKRIALLAGACVLFFVLFEGASSVIYVAYELWAPHEHRTLAGSSVRYDPELGWATVPSFNAPDYYAPGINLKINARGFRADTETSQQVADGRVRVICSGDSQTFGDGVSNDQTWCQDLSAINSRVDPVNLSETGYGADQMYLWYMRAGSGLDHSVHVFAIVTDDFKRMLYPVLGGYGKPVLRLNNGQLETTNVPVQQRSPVMHFLALKPQPLREFRLLAGMAWLAGRMAPVHDQTLDGPTPEQDRILDQIFASLVSTEKAKNSVLVLLYLPERVADYKPGGSSPAWRRWVRQEASKRGFLDADIIDDFQKLSVTYKEGLFIWQGSVQNFAETPGHYNPQGQAWVSQELYQRLAAIPELSSQLNLPVAQPGGRQHP